MAKSKFIRLDREAEKPGTKLTLQQKETIVKILRNGIKFAPQVGDYLINQSVFDGIEELIRQVNTPNPK